MSQTHFEIAELAESIAEENFSRGKVNLERIAKKNKIRIIHNDYGDAFLGELVHNANKFYIHLNTQRLDLNNKGRVRFTIAHEYGHYFIDEHRNKLVQGISLSHTTDHSMFSKNRLEKQANHFASNLLLPKGRFIRKCEKFEHGLDCILSLKESFNTSIECAAIRYIALDLVPCMFIKWNSDFSCKYSSYTKSLSKLTGLNSRPIIKADTMYLKALFDTYEAASPKINYIEEITSLSRWVATISPNSKTDLTGLEQTVKLGIHGGITFLIFSK
jgi:Zn-dependent peptidase ImmA (M78 family)